MANKNGSSKSKTNGSKGNERAAFVGYVNITLTEEDGIDFEAWLGQGGLADESYLEALLAGYQFTLKHDGTNDSFMCSVSSWDVSAHDAGIIYTGRAAESGRAVQKAVYVLTRKLDWNLANGYVKRQQQDAF